MFTGIVEELGKVKELRKLPDAALLTIDAEKVLEETRIGDSIAVNGVCLTVVKLENHQFTVDVMAETLAKSSLAQLSGGSRVNLERALQLSSRLGGHLVSGHVDGVGRIGQIRQDGIAKVVEIHAPPHLITYILPKGSIAIDGISLTVVDVGADYFSVSLIPHTAQETTLGFKGVGAVVNLETDMIGKYVARFLAQGSLDQEQGTGKKGSANRLSSAFLAENGFI